MLEDFESDFDGVVDALSESLVSDDVDRFEAKNIAKSRVRQTAHKYLDPDELFDDYE